MDVATIHTHLPVDDLLLHKQSQATSRAATSEGACDAYISWLPLIRKLLGKVKTKRVEAPEMESTRGLSSNSTVTTAGSNVQSLYYTSSSIPVHTYIVSDGVMIPHTAAM